MTLVICPGIHVPALSDRFIAALDCQMRVSRSAGEDNCPQPICVLPTEQIPPFSGPSVWSYLQISCDSQTPILLIGFSAGVVGAIAAAQLWQAQGRSVAALIAVDGWGVPAIGAFPIHRVSHDPFTHWSSALLGSGQDSFYADPAVSHLNLWQYPDRAIGCWVSASDLCKETRVTAIEFIVQMLHRHGCSSILQTKSSLRSY